MVDQRDGGDQMIETFVRLFANSIEQIRTFRDEMLNFLFECLEKSFHFVVHLNEFLVLLVIRLRFLIDFLHRRSKSSLIFIDLTSQRFPSNAKRKSIDRHANVAANFSDKRCRFSAFSSSLSRVRSISSSSVCRADCFSCSSDSS